MSVSSNNEVRGSIVPNPNRVTLALANIGRRPVQLMQCSFIETVGSIEWALSDCHFLPSETLSRDQSPGDWIDWIIDDLFGGAVKASIHVDQTHHPPTA